MKRAKYIIIYGVIILLCIAAGAGYLKSKSEVGPSNKNTVQSTVEKTAEKTTESIASDVKAAEASETAAAATETEPPEKIEHNAVMLTNGDNITGRSSEENQKHLKAVMKAAFEEPVPNPVVGIGRGTDYAAVTAEAIKNAGGMEDIVKKGDVVLIKPNICQENIDAGTGMITDYRVVQQIADMAYQYGASRVIVAEGAFYGNVFEYEKNRYVSLKGVELLNFNDCDKEDCYELKPKVSLTGRAIFIPKAYMDADVVIDVAKLKTHYLTWVSLSLKNCIGIPSAKIYGYVGYKNGIHAMGLDNAIIDLNRIRKPDLAVIDGIIGGEGYGPTSNTPVKSNIVLAGRDLVALDTVAINFTGDDISRCSHLVLAGKNGLGISDLSKIKIVGANLDSIKMKFKH